MLIIVLDFNSTICGENISYKVNKYWMNSSTHCCPIIWPHTFLCSCCHAPHLSGNVGKYSVVITNRNDGQNYESETSCAELESAFKNTQILEIHLRTWGSGSLLTCVRHWGFTDLSSAAQCPWKIYEHRQRWYSTCSSPRRCTIQVVSLEYFTMLISASQRIIWILKRHAFMRGDSKRDEDCKIYFKTARTKRTANWSSQ